MKKILIISTNQEMAPQPVAPIGAAWVAESLSLTGFIVSLLDLTFEKDPKKKVQNALAQFCPDGIGVSVRNVDNGDFLSPRSFIPQVKEITDLIKANTSAPILLGGSGVSIMPHQILDYLDLDYAVVGEGEEAAVSFFKAPDTAGSINGVVVRGSLEGQERKVWLGSPDLVRPRPHAWLDVKRYLRFEPVLPIQGKRGCANRCLYCTYNRIEGRSWRLREPALVAEEISNLILKTGAHTFEFVDSIFNQPEGYMEALLEEIIRWKLNAHFHIASMSPKGLTKKQVKLMERAGIRAAGITPESASDETLCSLRKGFTEDEVHRAAELLGGSNIKMLWCFLLGGPGENSKTIGKTVRFINGKLAKKDKAFITIGIRIYPHTGMHELAVRDGFITSDEQLLMPNFYFSPDIDILEARDELKRGLSSISNVIFLSDTQFSSLGFLRRMGTALHLPSPFWSYAGYMNMMIGGNRVINRDWAM